MFEVKGVARRENVMETLEKLNAFAEKTLGIREGISGKEAQPSITCSKLTMEALEQGAKYVQS